MTVLAAPPIDGEFIPYLRTLPVDEVRKILDSLDGLTEEDAYALELIERHAWATWARPEQLPPPGDAWRIWICISGRGGGKTRCGGEWINAKAEQHPGCHIGLLAATAADARDTMAAAILECAPPWARPRYFSTNRRILWPNGSYATTFSADEVEQTRGANLHFGWVDELAKFRDASGSNGQVTAWQNFEFAVRLPRLDGRLVVPQILITTTPRRTGRGAEIVKDLTLGKKVAGKRAIAAPAGDPVTWRPSEDVVVHKWSTDRNRANLAKTFLASLDSNYAGTTLEAQERHGEILDDVDGALWSADLIERFRVHRVPQLIRMLIALDPSHSQAGDGDEAGIIAGGLGSDGHAYIMADHSLRASPLTWARAAIGAYNTHRADGLVFETTLVQTDRGGNVVKDTIQAADPEHQVNWIPVHASRDKTARAEPVAALYEQGRVHHVGGFSVLEDEMVSWDRSNKASPNRLDALVWLVTALLLGDTPPPLEFL